MISLAVRVREVTEHRVPSSGPFYSLDDNFFLHGVSEDIAWGDWGRSSPCNISIEVVLERHERDVDNV